MRTLLIRTHKLASDLIDFANDLDINCLSVIHLLAESDFERRFDVARETFDIDYCFKHYEDFQRKCELWRGFVLALWDRRDLLSSRDEEEVRKELQWLDNWYKLSSVLDDWDKVSMPYTITSANACYSGGGWYISWGTCIDNEGNEYVYNFSNGLDGIALLPPTFSMKWVYTDEPQDTSAYGTCIYLEGETEKNFALAAVDFLRKNGATECDNYDINELEEITKDNYNI